MLLIAPACLAAGAIGVGVFLIVNSRAYGTEDSSGTTLPSSAGKLPPGTPLTLGAKAVDVGLRYLGIEEVPKGSNGGASVDIFLKGVYGTGAHLLKLPPASRAWCAAFVRYCFEKAAEELGLPPPFSGIKDPLTLVKSWRDVFGKYECEPKTGAVGLFIRMGVPGVDAGRRHATLVVRVEGDKVVTVEGNHNDEVALVSRPKKDFTVFLDVDRYVADHRPVISGSSAMLGLDVFSAGY